MPVRINAAKAYVNGAEFEMTVRPTDRLTLGGGFSYTDPQYDDDSILASVAVTSVGSVVGQRINLKDVPFGGVQMPTKWQGDLNDQCLIPMDSNGELRLGGDLIFRSKKPADNAKWFATFGGNCALQAPVP